MATVTHVCTLDYVAKMLGEAPELLEAIIYNDDNLSYGSIVSVYTGPDDTITVPTKTHVLNLLHRLVDGKVIGGPPLDRPQALALHREPKANVERYDGLRSQISGGRHAS